MLTKEEVLKIDEEFVDKEMELLITFPKGEWADPEIRTNFQGAGTLFYCMLTATMKLYKLIECARGDRSKEEFRDTVIGFLVEAVLNASEEEE